MLMFRQRKNCLDRVVLYCIVVIFGHIILKLYILDIYNNIYRKLFKQPFKSNASRMIANVLNVTTFETLKRSFIDLSLIIGTELLSLSTILTK